MSQVAGNSIPILIGRRVYLVSYVSMAEWETFDEFLQRDSKSDEALVYLYYCSLHRADPTITKRKVKRMLRWHKSIMTLVLDVLYRISLPAIKTDGSEKVKPGQAEKNMKVIYRVLSRTHGWAPQQINDMSPAQVHIYLTGGTTGTGLVKMSDAEYKDFLNSRGKQVQNG